MTHIDGRELKRGGKILLLCSCDCGEELERARSNIKPSGLHYVSLEHAGRHRTRVYLEDMCGPMLGVALEYLDGFAKQHYKDLSTVRAAIGPFMLFLNEKGITDLESIKPGTLSQFLDWAEEVEYTNAAHSISLLTGFFQWANRHGYRRSACPVMPKFHGKKRLRYLPRPYSNEEMTLIWRWANERGTVMIRAALAVAQESGLRLGELCNLRLQDVDLQGLRLFVRLPNKGDCERWAFFTDRAARYITEWLKVRDATCNHNHLFQNRRQAPLLPQVMHDEFCIVFCKPHEGKSLHEEGLEQWSTHRLRHTMATNLASGGAAVTTIMKAGGWESVSSMLLYTQADLELARRGYDEAMSRAYSLEQKPPSREVISPGDFLAEYGASV